MAETLIRLDKQTRAQTLIVGPNKTTDSDANVTVNTSGVTNDIAAAGAMVIQGHTANPGTLTIKRGRTATDYTSTVFTAEGKVDARGAGHFDGNLDTDGTLVVDGASTLTGNVAAAGTLGVTGAATLSSTLAVTGASTLTGNVSAGGTLGVTGAATLSSTLAVTGASTLTGNASCGGTLGVTGAATLSSTLAVTGASTLTGNVSCGGTLAVTGTSTLTGTATTGSILPAADSTHNLGSDAVRYATIYCDTLDAATLDTSGLTIASTDSDTFTVNAETTPTNVAGDGSKFILKNYDGTTARTAFLSCTNAGAVKIDGTNLASVTLTPATTISGAATLSSTLAVTGATTGSTASFTGTGHFGGNLDTDGTLVVDGASTLTGLVTSSAGMNISGADLAMSGKNITLGDSAGSTDDRLVFGAGSELSLYHDTTNSWLVNTEGNVTVQNTATAGEVQVKLGTTTAATKFRVMASDGSTNPFSAYANGDVEFNGSSATTVTVTPVLTPINGMNISGGNLAMSGKNITLGDSAASTDDRLVLGATSDLSVYHSATDSYIVSSEGDLVVQNSATAKDIKNKLGTATTATAFSVLDSADAVNFKVKGSGAAEHYIPTNLAGGFQVLDKANSQFIMGIGTETAQTGLVLQGAGVSNTYFAFGNPTSGYDETFTAVSAELSNVGHASDGVKFTACGSGNGGNNIRVRFVAGTGANTATSVTVSGTDITVTLGTNGSSVVDATATGTHAVVTAVNSDASARALVLAAAVGAGTTTLATVAYTALAGGQVNSVMSGTTTTNGLLSVTSDLQMDSGPNNALFSFGDDTVGLDTTFTGIPASVSNMGHATQGVNFTAQAPGDAAGTAIRVRFRNTGASQALSVSVSGKDISVVLATNGSSVITSTAQDVITLIDANASAVALVSASLASTSATLTTASDTYSSLSGGLVNADVSGTLTLGGAATLSSTLAVTGASTLTGNVSCSGTLGVTGAATLSSTLAVTGASTLTGNVTASGTLGVTGATTLSSTLGVTGLITATGGMNIVTGQTLNVGTSGTTSPLNLYGNFAQSGATTFGTGTGAVSLNGDVTVAANKTLTLSGTGTTTLGNAVTVIGDATTDTITFTGRLTTATALIPVDSGTCNLGATSLPFSNIFVNTIQGATATTNPAIYYSSGNAAAAAATTNMATALDNVYNAANIVIQDLTGGTVAALTTSSAHVSGKVLAWKNGAMLRGSGNDFTDTNSTTITLATAPVASDVVVLMYFKA